MSVHVWLSQRNLHLNKVTCCILLYTLFSGLLFCWLLSSLLIFLPNIKIIHTLRIKNTTRKVSKAQQEKKQFIGLHKDGGCYLYILATQEKRKHTHRCDPVDVFLGVLCLDMKINDVNAALLNMKYAF